MDLIHQGRCREHKVTLGAFEVVSCVMVLNAINR
jgi:hypothetical protein